MERRASSTCIQQNRLQISTFNTTAGVNPSYWYSVTAKSYNSKLLLTYPLRTKDGQYSFVNTTKIYSVWLFPTLQMKLPSLRRQLLSLSRWIFAVKYKIDNSLRLRWFGALCGCARAATARPLKNVLLFFAEQLATAKPIFVQVSDVSPTKTKTVIYVKPL